MTLKPVANVGLERGELLGRQTPSAERQAQAREALGRLQRRQGPTEIRLVLLALMMNPDNPSERKWWLQHAQALPQADQILDEVAQLLPHTRVPEFERVTDTLQTLDVDARREVVILADMHDASYEEIAATLEIPIGTVRSRLHRGRLELRSLLVEP